MLPACGVPERFALPVPVPLTQGGTTVPAEGAGGMLEFGDGLLGQELLRTDMISIGAMAGVGDRFSASVHSFTETRGNEMEGTFVRAKVRAGSPAGPASSVAVAVTFSTSDRAAGDVQDERVTTFDLAVPAEFRLASSESRRRDFSAYAGPRIARINYDDRLEPAFDLNSTYWGGLIGVHARISNFHFFGEASLIRLPARTARGVAYDGRWTVSPALGIAFHFGKVHEWPAITPTR